MVERTGAVDVEGRAVPWQSLGDGPPLLLVNGYAATVADWDPRFVAALACSFRVICPESRGMGEAPLGDPAAVTIDGLAADLEALLDGLGIERAAVAGWSMGGFVAQRLTVRARDRVRSLILMSTDPGGDAAVRAAPEVWAELTDHSGTAREQATRLIALLFPPEVARDVDRQFGELVAAARRRLSAQALTAQERAMAGWHGTAHEAAGDDAPPVLIAHGESDVVIPPANASALAAHWPVSTVERLTGGGHAFMAQEPDRLAGLIERFAAAF